MSEVWLKPTVLENQWARLEPLVMEHQDGLLEALADGEAWKLWYTWVPSPDQLRIEIAKRLEHQRKEEWLPFAVIDRATGKVAGMTNFMHADTVHKRVEIGGTWYANRYQRTPLNTACKHLLLSHAFEQLGCIAVELRTHFFNRQSRAAIERLGAKLDGILRNHARSRDGMLRDTCVYSILPSEWPTVKTNLEYLLSR